jgi:uncharacterized membrane protein
MKKMNYHISGLAVHKVFLFAALFWGTIMVFLVPPYQVPDEPAHFYRAYQVSLFDFKPEVRNNRLGGELPVSLQEFYSTIMVTPGNKEDKLTVAMLEEALKIRLNPGDTKFFTFPNTALYSPVPYLPQAMGITIGRVLKLSPLAVFYLARLFNFMVWLLIVFTAIKIMPVKKWLFLILALTPMSVHIAGSASADALLNAVSFLFIALTFSIAFSKNAMLDFRNLALLIILAVGIAFSKNIYVVLTGLFFIIPGHKSGTRQKHLRNGALLLGTAFLAFAVSSLFVSHLMHQINPIEHFYGNENAPRINPGEQISYILSDIPGFLLMAVKSFATNWYLLFSSFTGNLGWLEVTFHNSFYLLSYLIILFLAVFRGEKNNPVRLSDKLIFLLVAVSGLLAFSFTMYCSWCEPGSDIIENLQGRYFIPFAPLIPLLFVSSKFTIRKQTVFPAVAIALIILSFGLTVLELAERYW